MVYPIISLKPVNPWVFCITRGILVSHAQEVVNSLSLPSIRGLYRITPNFSFFANKIMDSFSLLVTSAHVKHKQIPVFSYYYNEGDIMRYNGRVPLALSVQDISEKYKV